VTAQIRDESGKIEEVRANWLIGCDGVRSTVRTILEIPFTGTDFGLQFALCDAIIEWPGHGDGWRYVVSEKGFLILVPLSDTHTRVVVAANKASPAVSDWFLDKIQNLLSQIGFDDLLLRDPIWISSAYIYDRLAAQYQVGRVFLAGDAAHVFSPIGGQGMNTGLQDGFNLACRLATYQQGFAASTLLLGYQIERRAVAVAIRSLTARLTSAIALLDGSRNVLSRHFLPSARGSTFLRTVLPLCLAGFSINFDSGLGTARSAALSQRATRTSAV
jgi:2-polyprenyl-6-methoxyphenol hydroxylase-like FAD-dependent oxidoreductase